MKTKFNFVISVKSLHLRRKISPRAIRMQNKRGKTNSRKGGMPRKITLGRDNDSVGLNRVQNRAKPKVLARPKPESGKIMIARERKREREHSQRLKL